MRKPPLTGIRVLDLSNVLAGPFCCHQLAHLGAEVIKIERPQTGDLARQLGADPALSARDMGVSFLAQNAGKASVTLDLKDPRGADILKRLVREADVLVENFRPGVMERLGLGPDVLRAENPHLIYAAISGFGQSGPWKDRPAYDQIVQGIAGVMSVTGHPEDGPMRAGYPVADTVAGLTAAMAISAALAAPERGCVIDVSMLEATLATMGWAISNYLIAGQVPRQNGNDNPTSAPSGMFRTRDGHINIAANTEDQWRALARHLDRGDLLETPAFADRDARKANRKRLTAELETVLTTRDSAHWVEAFNALSIPAGEVLSLPEILAHPQIAERDFVARYEDVDGVAQGIDIVRTGARIDAQPLTVSGPPPALGNDTDRILTALGIDADALAALRADGVI